MADGKLEMRHRCAGAYVPIRSADHGESRPMPTAVLTDRERAAVQAYLRLMQTVRAAFDGPPEGRRPPVVPTGALAEAEHALAAAGLAGNEEEFFRLLRSWCPEA